MAVGFDQKRHRSLLMKSVREWFMLLEKRRFINKETIL